MENLSVYDIVLVPVIIALVLAATHIGMPKKWAPILSLVLGIAMGIFYVAPHDPKEGILVGLALGIAAVGVHSGTKNTVELKDE